jgi:pyruvate,water dikinase
MTAMHSVEVTRLADATDPARHGGKATALATLIRHGLPVPDGLVLPADLPDDKLASAVSTVLDWATSVDTRYGLVARSSAPAEDGPEASFAGLYTSRFTPARSEALLAAVHEVRASATTPALGAYAARHRMRPTAHLAILVQPAIRPHAAGVLAAALDAGDLRLWALDAVRGLALPVVDGSQRGERHHSASAGPTPAEQEVILLPGTATELRQPPGEWIILPAAYEQPLHRAKIQTSAAGLLHLYAPAQNSDANLLTTGTRNRLLSLASHVAAALSLDHIDIEWAVTVDRTIHILQARPLTSPVPESAADAPPSDDSVWHGIPAAPGRGAGPAHYLHPEASTHTDEMPAGAVLICGNIGPEALPALLSGPAAIAATSGGPLSHAAIVAREIGIPCVTALPVELLKVMPGTRLTVDGTAGTVRRAATTEEPPRRQPPTLADAAVITQNPPANIPDDGRAATLLLHFPGDELPLLHNKTEAASHSTDPPVGVFQPSEEPALPSLPSGYQEHHLPGLGRIAWPNDAGPLPGRLVALENRQQISERSTHPTAKQT